MNDMSSVIAPKSDQLNSDSLISGPLTIRIRDVAIRPGTEQPVSIFYDGDDNKPWKPCKSMSRVLVSAWGPDANQYIGRSATLYRDPDVTWGGMKVGGIRVSHVSHIDKPMALALTATKGKKAIATIKPLQVQQSGQPQQQARQTAEEWTDDYIAKVEATTVLDALTALQTRSKAALDKLKSSKPDLHMRAEDAGTKQAAKLAPVDHQEGRSDSQMGEGFTEDPDNPFTTED